MPNDAAIARLEEKTKGIEEKIDSYFSQQAEINRKMLDTRDDVIAIQASARGAWWTVGVFGSLTVAVSSAVAWFVSRGH